ERDNKDNSNSRLRGGRVSRQRPLGSNSCPIRPDRKIAVLLVEKRVEPLVITRRQIEEPDECAVAAAGFLQTAIDQCRQFSASDFVRPEWLLNNVPEIAACHQLVPQML